MKTFESMRRSDGMILVSTLLILLALTTLGITIMDVGTGDVRLAANHRDSKQAYYASEAGIILSLEEGVNRPLNELLAGPDGMAGTSDDGQIDFACCGTQIALEDGTDFRVSIRDNRDEVPDDPTQDADGQVFLVSEGVAPMGSRWRMETLMRRVCDEGSDGNLRGAATANGPVNSKGNLIIDGRDHDLDGNVIPGQGKKAVSTRGTYSRDGSSSVGGTDYTVDPPVDIAPTTVGIDNIVEDNATWVAPLTPDEVLGMPDGKLREIAQSRHNGSQYTTNPLALTMPVSGVTYVEMPDCGIWNPAQVVGEGVLVVHDVNTCSIVKNFQAMSYFHGILIADDLIHLEGNGVLLGAVFVLSQTPSEGSSIGNGTLDVLYSSQSIENALGSIATCSMEILSWNYE